MIIILVGYCHLNGASPETYGKKFRSYIYKGIADQVCFDPFDNHYESTVLYAMYVYHFTK